MYPKTTLMWAWISQQFSKTVKNILFVIKNVCSSYKRGLCCPNCNFNGYWIMQNIKQNIKQMQMIRWCLSIGHSPTFIFFSWSCINIKYLETTELLYIERGSTKTQCQQKGTHNGVVPDLQIKCASRFASKSAQRTTKFHFYQQNHTNTFNALVFWDGLFII